MTEPVIFYRMTIDVVAGTTTREPLGTVEDFRTQHASSLTAEVRDHVNAAYDPDEQTLLMIDLGQVKDMQRDGVDLSAHLDVFGRLIGAMRWVEAARELGAALEDACEAATTMEELQAVRFDPATLGTPPPVRSRETRKAIRAVRS